MHGKPTKYLKNSREIFVIIPLKSMIVFHIKNMMIPIFYIGADTYKKQSELNNEITYYSKNSGKIVKITDKGSF